MNGIGTVSTVVVGDTRVLWPEATWRMGGWVVVAEDVRGRGVWAVLDVELGRTDDPGVWWGPTDPDDPDDRPEDWYPFGTTLRPYLTALAGPR